MSYCTACGAATEEDLFCSQCGQPTARATAHPSVESESTGWSGPALAAAASPVAGQSVGVARLRQLPVELLVVSGLMGLAGVILLVMTLLLVPPAFEVLTAGGDFWIFGLALLSGLILVGGVAVGMVLLAWRLTTGDRVARGLAYVLLGAVVAAVLVGRDLRFPLVLVLLGSLASAALLAFSPPVNEYFRASTRHGDAAVSVVIARTLILWWGFAVIVIGASLLPLAGLDGGSALLGLLLVGLGVGAFVVSAAIARGEARARIAVTVAAAVYAVLPFINGQWRSAIVPLTFAIGLVTFLWVPPDAKAHFQQVS